MNGVKFEGLLRELDENSLETLLSKNARFVIDFDIPDKDGNKTQQKMIDFTISNTN